MDCAAIAKAHFDLGRVHIHINAARFKLQEQHISGLLFAVQHILIRVAHSVAHGFVAHKAAIDIGVLHIGAAARGIGQTGKTGHADAAKISRQRKFNRQRLRHKVSAQHGGHALGQSACAPLFDQLALVPNAKAHIGAHQRVAAHGFDAMRQLGIVRF